MTNPNQIENPLYGIYLYVDFDGGSIYERYYALLTYTEDS